MTERMATVTDSMGKPIIRDHPALSQFCFENGYEFRGTLLGSKGVKIELVHKDDREAAIILPPAEARQCARWLLGTTDRQDRSLPKDLAEILQRIINIKKPHPALKRGDKRKIKDALRALKE